MQGDPSGEHPPEEEGRRDREQRMQRPEQRGHDAVEAGALGERDRTPLTDQPMRLRPEHEHRAGDTGTGSAEGQCLDDAPLDAHPGIPRRVRIVADRPETHAERTPEEQDVAEDRHSDGDQHAEMQPRPPGEQREIGVHRQPLRLLDLDRALLDQQVLEQEAEELRGDDVEHDRAEDLVDPRVRLQHSGNRTPDATPDSSRQHDQRDEENTG